MVDLAYKNLSPGRTLRRHIRDLLCLPDAIQLLPPRAAGNGWLRVVDLGRFALSLYHKYTGEGVRVYVRSQILDNWPHIKASLFKLQPKREQDFKN